MRFKNLLGYSIAGAIGGLIGYIVSDYLCHVVEEKMIMDYMREIREDENILYGDEESSEPEEVIKSDMDIEEEIEEEWVPEQPMDEKRNRLKRHHTDYNLVNKNVKPNLADIATDIVYTNLSGQFRSLSEEEFCTRNPDFVQLELTYYDDDDVLVDDQEKVIAKPEEVIGNEALLQFGVFSGDPDIVYIRDEKNMIQYEIARVHGSYSKLVLGFEEEPKKTKKRNTKKESDNE